MELRHLRYFVAVAEELSFRRASERLRVSRPALSKQIKDLENEIGVRLMDRDTVSVSLTKAGEVFFDDARDLLKKSEAAVERAAAAQAGHLGRLRIGSVGVISTDFLPETLRLFNGRYPEVEVAFVEMLPVEQLDALSRGEIDIGFAYGSDAGGNPDHHSLCVVQSIFGVAVSRNHPWVGRGEIPLEEIKDANLLCLGRGRSVHREEICKFCSEEGFVPAKVRQVDGFDSLLTLIAADQGVSLLPKVLDLTNHGVTIVPLEVNQASLDFRMWAVWERDNPSEIVHHFVELLRQRDVA